MSPVGEDETPVHEISSCDSPKPVNEGAEDREEEAATDDSVVEQQEEHEIASVWEVNESSSVAFGSRRLGSNSRQKAVELGGSRLLLKEKKLSPRRTA